MVILLSCGELSYWIYSGAETQVDSKGRQAL